MRGWCAFSSMPRGRRSRAEPSSHPSRHGDGPGFAPFGPGPTPRGGRLPLGGVPGGIPGGGGPVAGTGTLPEGLERERRLAGGTCPGGPGTGAAGHPGGTGSLGPAARAVRIGPGVPGIGRSSSRNRLPGGREPGRDRIRFRSRGGGSGRRFLGGARAGLLDPGREGHRPGRLRGVDAGGRPGLLSGRSRGPDHGSRGPERVGAFGPPLGGAAPPLAVPPSLPSRTRRGPDRGKRLREVHAGPASGGASPPAREGPGRGRRAAGAQADLEDLRRGRRTGFPDHGDRGHLRSVRIGGRAGPGGGRLGERGHPECGAGIRFRRPLDRG